MPESFTLPTLEEELEELRGVGIDVDTGPLQPGDDDAAASQLLRVLAAIDLELDRLARAEERAHQLATATYERQRTPVLARRQVFEAALLDLARRAVFGGKKKSRAVPYGTYGRRGSAETVKITDPDRAIPWCEAHGLGHLVQSETKTVKKLPHATAKDALLAYIKAHEGEQPDGIEYIAEKDEPFAKPDVAVLAAEQGTAQEAR